MAGDIRIKNCTVQELIDKLSSLPGTAMVQVGYGDLSDDVLIRYFENDNSVEIEGVGWGGDV